VYPDNKPVIKGVNVHNKTTTKYQHINNNNDVMTVMQQTIMEYIIRTNPEWIVKYAVNTECCKNVMIANIKDIYDNLAGTYDANKTIVSKRSLTTKSVTTNGLINYVIDIPNGWNNMLMEKSRISTQKPIMFNSVDYINMQIVLMIKYEMAMHSGNVIDVYNVAVKNVNETVNCINRTLKHINGCDTLTDEHYEEINKLSTVILCANVDNFINKCVSVRYVPIIMRIFKVLDTRDVSIDGIVDMCETHPEIIKSLYKLNRDEREQVAVMDIIGREYISANGNDYTLMTTIVECSNAMNDNATVKVSTDKLAYSADWSEEKARLFTAIVDYVKEKCPENLSSVTNPRVVRERIERCGDYLDNAIVGVDTTAVKATTSWSLW
jgi:hypothetical protein